MERLRQVFNSWYLFIPRLILWVGCTFVCPICLIMSKFKVFEKVEGDKIQFNGWAIIIILIVGIGLFYLLKYILKAMTYNYVSQIINGFITLVLWLILAYLLVDYISKFKEEIEWILKWYILSASLGVLINPLPRWSYNRKNKDIAVTLGTYLDRRGR